MADGNKSCKRSKEHFITSTICLHLIVLYATSIMRHCYIFLLVTSSFDLCGGCSISLSPTLSLLGTNGVVLC
jgi:hypothetical protein